MCRKKAEDALITPKLPDSGGLTLNLPISSGFATTSHQQNWKANSRCANPGVLILALKCARCTYRGSQPWQVITQTVIVSVIGTGIGTMARSMLLNLPRMMVHQANSRSWLLHNIKIKGFGSSWYLLDLTVQKSYVWFGGIVAIERVSLSWCSTAAAPMLLVPA